MKYTGPCKKLKNINCFSTGRRHAAKCRKSNGFTIVELLVVVVIIGILATVTIVSYTGIVKKASVAVLKSDIRNAATTLELDKAITGVYPANEAAANGGKGLPKSTGTSYQYTVVGSDYNLSVTSIDPGQTAAFYVSSTNPGVIADGVWSGHLAPGAGVSWSQVSIYEQHACAIDSNGKAYCWGWNQFGQLGNSSQTDSLPIVAVNTDGVLSGLTIKSIGVGTNHTCAVASDDKVYCWGMATSNVLGIDWVYNGYQKTTPVAITTDGALGTKTVKSLKTGADFNCAIASDDKVYCWGNNTYGQLGDGTNTASFMPVAVNTADVLNGKTIKSISAGGHSACVVASDDKAYCWGDNTRGQLGDNTTTASSVAVAVNTAGVLSGKTIKSISTSYAHTCAIASDDKAYCWGSNAYGGELGNNSSSDSYVPVTVDATGVLAGKTIKSISSGSYFTCSIASDDKGYCWGGNNYGNLGTNSWPSYSYVPVAVYNDGALSGLTLKSIEIGAFSTCAIASDNNIYCWGWNNKGQLGDNTTDIHNAPVLSQMPPQS